MFLVCVTIEVISQSWSIYKSIKVKDKSITLHEEQHGEIAKKGVIAKIGCQTTLELNLAVVSKIIFCFYLSAFPSNM